jgi:hypothetical protein
VTVPTGPEPADGVGVTHHPDPRGRHRLAPPVDALAAAVRLDQATAAMRASRLEHGPVPLADEPPTGLLDLAALRAAVAAGPAEDVDPAAAAWLAGGPDPAAARVVEQVDALEVPSSPAPASVAAPVAPAAPPTPAPVPVPRVFTSEREPRPGWRSRHDVRSLSYGLRARLAGSAPLTDHVWPTGPVLDQGQEGECVGCGLVDAVNALRRAAGRTDLLKIDAAAGLYHRAQQLDDVPGEAYTGTSVLAGLKAATEEQLIGGYLWCFGTRDVAQAVLQRGPVVVGVPWLSGMYDTGPGGLVQVTGTDTGAGHCLAVVGIRLKGPQGQPGPYFVWQNSWGAVLRRRRARLHPPPRPGRAAPRGGGGGHRHRRPGVTAAVWCWRCYRAHPGYCYP